MPTTCTVDFENNPLKVIYSGHLLRGTVRLNVVEEKSMRGVFIRIYGKGLADWKEGKSRYTGKETYLDERVYFLGGSNDEVKLVPGYYEYPFECMLPAGLPTSVEGEFGYIRYVTRVVFDIPMWPDTTFEDPFTVIRPLDLNEDPALREPVVVRENRTFFPYIFLCCCPSDPVTIIARVPGSGYTPGQTIDVDIDVNNKSNQEISKFSVKLIKEITYRNKSLIFQHEKVQEMDIAFQEPAGCNVGEEKHINVCFRVPSTPPSDFSSSTVVKVRYLIRVIGVVAYFHYNPTVNIPITIGTYPIRDIASNKIQVPSAPSASGAAYPSLNEGDDPPTYEDAMFTNNTDDSDFKPKYPVFNRTTSYSRGP